MQLLILLPDVFKRPVDIVDPAVYDILQLFADVLAESKGAVDVLKKLVNITLHFIKLGTHFPAEFHKSRKYPLDLPGIGQAAAYPLQGVAVGAQE